MLRWRSGTLLGTRRIVAEGPREEQVVHHVRFFFLVVGLVLAGASPGHAAPVTVNFTGQVTSSEYVGIPVDSLVTGSYAYNDAAAPTILDVDYAKYDIDLFTLAFVDGSTIVTVNPHLSLVDHSGVGPFGADRYSVASYGPVIATGSFADVPLLTVALARSDSSGTAWTDFPAIPSPSDVLTLFPEDQSGVWGDLYVDPYTRDLYFDITSLSVTSPVVPVPGALVLGAIGVACTGWRLRRHKAL